MNNVERIAINPNQCGGGPCIRALRIRVKHLLGTLAARLRKVEVRKGFHSLESVEIHACLQSAVAQTDHAILAGTVPTA
jgi:uncharacterized protein (DUF433 family)